MRTSSDSGRQARSPLAGSDALSTWIAEASRRPAGERSLLESLGLILSFRGQPILVVLLAATIALVLGVLLLQVDGKYGAMGAETIVALTLLVLAAAAIALALPVLSLIALVAVSFSSSSAVLHGEYGLPIVTKYLPMVLFGALVLQAVRRSRNVLLPRRLWLQPSRSSGLSTPFVVCLSMLGVYFLFTLLPLVYAPNVELAAEELALQNRRFLFCLAIAFSVGQFGRWSSLHSLCTIATYATSAVVLLAIVGSFVPSLESVLPGFTYVYQGSSDPGDTGSRIAGAYGHPNSLGRYAVFTMPVAICLAVLDGGLRRLLAVLCLLILLAGMMLSESRGAMLVTAVVAFPALAVTVRRVKVRHWLPALICGALVMSAAWQFVDTERIDRSFQDAAQLIEDGTAPSDGATRGRLSEMRIAYELWRSHPFFGIGLANYEHYFQIYSFDFGTKLYNADRAAHSMYLETLAERGIVGLFGFLLAVGGILLTVLNHGLHILRDGDKAGGYLTLSLVVSALTYYMSAMILHDVHSSPIWALIGLMLASVRPTTSVIKLRDGQREVVHGTRRTLR